MPGPYEWQSDGQSRVPQIWQNETKVQLQISPFLDLNCWNKWDAFGDDSK